MMKRIASAILSLFLCLGSAAQPAQAEQVVLPISQLTTEYKDKIVSVQGAVMSARRFSAGMRYTLKDEQGSVTLVVFDRVLNKIKAPSTIGAGAELRVRATVNVYRGQIELIANRADDIVVVKAAVIVPDGVTKLNAIGPADKGKTFSVEGVVVNTASFSAGFKFTLNDGTGQIVLVLFESEYDRMAKREALNLGARVQVKGVIDTYFSEVQIVPKAADVLATAGTPPVIQAYKLGGITGNDHNSLAQVTGEVVGVEPFESGTTLTLKDATGVQKVTLYSNIAKRIPSSVKLTTGSKVTLIGRIRASKYTGIRIEVALPYDIKNAK